MFVFFFVAKLDCYAVLHGLPKFYRNLDLILFHLVLYSLKVSDLHLEWNKFLDT